MAENVQLVFQLLKTDDMQFLISKTEKLEK